MAPTTRRSNRTSSSTLAKGTSIDIPDGKESNTKGLSALPAEIYLEILSHMPAMPIPTHQSEHGPHTEPDIGTLRHLTLSTLSQTCRSLRKTFLPYLWERIEVFDGMQIPQGRLPTAEERTRASRNSVRLKLYAEELVRQLETVTVRNPGLAGYVSFANIVVTYYSAESVLKELAEALTLLPNLHTVKLRLMPPSYVVEAVFKNERYRYPQIRVLSLNRRSLFFAQLCPGLRSILSQSDEHPFHVLPRNCPSVEVLGIVVLSTRTEISFIDYMKNLRDISMIPDPAYFRPHGLEPLLSLPRLHTIRIRMDRQSRVVQYSGETVPTDQEIVDTYVQVAREHALIAKQTRTRTSTGAADIKKKIIVTFKDARVQVYNI